MYAYFSVNQLVSLPSVAHLVDNLSESQRYLHAEHKGEEEHDDVEVRQASPLTFCTKF